VSAKQQQLEEALRRLLEEANAARGDRDAPDVVDKQQLERLQTTLARYVVCLYQQMHDGDPIGPLGIL
jgi:hypothetical protein